MTVEKRQSRLYKNREDNARWMKRLLRAATELKRIDVEYRRLLRGRRDQLKFRPSDFPLGAAGGGAVEGLNDNLEGL